MDRKAGFSLIEVVVAAGFVGLIIVSGFFLNQKYFSDSITDYESCKEARGSIIMEIYPEQCRAKDGSTFTRILSIEELERLNTPVETNIDNNVIQAVPVLEFEDTQEMTVHNEKDTSLPPSILPKPIEDTTHKSPSSPPIETIPFIPTPIEEKGGNVTWNNHQGSWEPSGTPPACPSPLILKTPIDISLATSILYPGQSRGGNYKAHGGFRFDNSNSDDITVVAPMDGVVVDGGRALVNGEIQYLFDFINSCGIWYRFGHLKELSPKFTAIAEMLPKAVENDSRTHRINGISVTKGEVIATAVGLSEENNTFVDWGVYDLRSKNTASGDSSWAQSHPSDQAQHAICWFDLLSPADAAIVQNLPPSDGISGAVSDYCL